MDETPDVRAFRASDADREQVAEALRQAVADGRLTLTELQERIEQLYAAKTYGDIAPVVHDLPGIRVMLRGPNAAGTAPIPAPAVPDRVGGAAGGSSSAVAVFSGAVRKGQWVVPQELSAVAVFGGVELDLTHARLAGREVTIRAVAVFGGVEITVPPDIHVVVNGAGVFGGYADDTSPQPPPGAPVVHINGAAVFGGVAVKRSRKTS